MLTVGQIALDISVAIKTVSCVKNVEFFHGELQKIFDLAYPLPAVFIMLSSRNPVKAIDGTNSYTRLINSVFDLYIMNQNITNNDFDFESTNCLDSIREVLDFRVIQNRELMWFGENFVVSVEDGRYLYKVSYKLNDVLITNKKNGGCLNNE